MLTLQCEKGCVTISENVIRVITGSVVCNCFGVKGMAYRTMTDGIVHILKREAISKGVSVTSVGGSEISIALRIVVKHGVNIPVVSRSIIEEVSYHVNRLTGVKVCSVDVFIDSIVVD